MTEQEVQDVQEVQEAKVVEPVVDQEHLNKIVKYHVWSAAGLGLVPVPLFGLVAVTGVQLNMLRKISGIYGIPFSKNVVKNILGSLLGALVPTGVAFPLASAAKAVPAVGTILGVLAMPVFASASTWAVAKIFIQHFASGGTFLTFNPEKVREHYRQLFQEGQAQTAEPVAAAA
jgi:uncharacterized protein (DUF697 family)